VRVFIDLVRRGYMLKLRKEKKYWLGSVEDSCILKILSYNIWMKKQIKSKGKMLQQDFKIKLLFKK